MIKKSINALKYAVFFVFVLLFLIMRSSSVKSGVPILLYHAVENNIFGIEGLFVKPSEFYKQMEYLHDNGYTTLTFDEIGNYYKYKKPILITFDDGYSNIYFHAFPVLKKFNQKATMFLISGQINMPYFLTQKEILEMTGAFSFQSHTVSHPELDKASKKKIEQECVQSKEAIEKLTGKPVNTISFPSGRYNKAVVDIASKYYKYCVTTNYGIYNSTDDRHEINRIYITHNDTLNDFIKKLKFAE